VGWLLFGEVVKPAKVVSAIAVGGGDRLGCRLRGDAARRHQPAHAGLGRSRRQHAQDVGARRQRHRRGMREDHGAALFRDLMDRGLDEEAQILCGRVVALVLRGPEERHAERECRRRWPEEVTRSVELRHQLRQQRLAVFHRCDELGVDLRQACRPLDHLLVDVAKAQAIGDETADLFAQGSERPGDTYDLHRQDVLLQSGRSRRSIDLAPGRKRVPERSCPCRRDPSPWGPVAPRPLLVSPIVASGNELTTPSRLERRGRDW